MAIAKKGLAAYLEAAKNPDSLFAEIQHHVMKKAAQSSDRRIDCIHPSEAIKDDWCIRSNYFRIVTNIAHNPRQTTFRLENIFQEGHNTHSKWQRWLTEMGKLEGDWLCHVCGGIFYARAELDAFGTLVLQCPSGCHGEVTYEELSLENKELRISGRTDGYVPGLRRLIEIKTMSFGGLKYDQKDFVEPYEKYMYGKSWVALDNLWRDFRRPLKSARRQGQLYLWLARERGIDVDKIQFIYDFKANQETKSFLIEYDPSIIEDVLEKCRHIAGCVAANIAPECNIRGPELCANCRPYEVESP